MQPITKCNCKVVFPINGLFGIHTIAFSPHSEHSTAPLHKRDGAALMFTYQAAAMDAAELALETISISGPSISPSKIYSPAPLSFSSFLFPLSLLPPPSLGCYLIFPCIIVARNFGMQLLQMLCRRKVPEERDTHRLVVPGGGGGGSSRVFLATG